MTHAASAASVHLTAEGCLTALGRVMARVTARADREQVASTLADGLVAEFGAALARIWLYDPTRDTIHLRATAGLIRAPSIGGDPIPLAETSPPVAAALLARRPLLLDPLGPTSGLRDQVWLTTAGVRAYAGFPLVVGERLSGYAMVTFRDSPIPPLVRDALTLLVGPAALALDRARLVDETHALQGVAADLASTRDPTALLDGIVERTMAVLGADACSVELLDETSGRLRPAAVRGLSATSLDTTGHAPRGDSDRAFRQIQRTGRPRFTRVDPTVGSASARAVMARLAAEGIVGTLRLPLFAPGGRVVGVLTLYHRRERPYGDEEVRLAQAFADQLAATLHNARLAEQERRTAQERAALLEIARKLASTVELEPLLNVILDQLQIVIDYTGAAVSLLEGDTLRQIVRRAPTPNDPHLPGPHRSLEPRALPPDHPIAAVVLRGEAVIIDDLQGPSPLARAFRASYDVPFERTPLHYIHAWMAVPLVVGERVIGMLILADARPAVFTPHHADLVAAIAAQAAAAIENARLFEEERRTAAELATVLRVARNVSSTLDLGPLLGQILDQIKLVIDYASAAVVTREVGRFVTREYRGPLPREVVLARSLPQELFELATLAAARRGQVVIIPDVWADTPDARDYRAFMGEDYLRTAADYLRCSLSAPLVSHGELIGALVLTHRTPGFFTARHAALVRAIADQATVAIENARLYEETRAAQAAAARQLERLATLAQITSRLLAATDLDTVLRVVVEAGHRLCDATMGMVGLIDDDTQQIIPVAFDGEPRAYFEQFVRPLLDEDFLAHTATGQALTRRAAVAVDDYATWPDRHRLQAKTVALGVRAMIAAPLLVDGVPTGVLWVNDTRPRPFAAEDVALVQALADQAALAIEHARLTARGRDAAALEERARLARDLHDSVTQSVFSLGLFTRSAQTQYARGSEQVGETLGRLATLAQDALAEMRALLFALRPAALEQEGLAGALDKLVAAMRARSELTLTLAAETSTRLPAETEAAIFRIVQEALGNAAKHAQATTASVRLVEQDGVLTVEVRDNGVGFDPNAPVAASADGRSGGMGLRSMRDRATAAGLQLRVQSAPGAGTTVAVAVPVKVGRP